MLEDIVKGLRVTLSIITKPFHVLSTILRGHWSRLSLKCWKSETSPSPPVALWEKLEDTVAGLRITLNNIDKPLHVIPENNHVSFEDQESVGAVEESREDYNICNGVIEKYLKMGKLPEMTKS